MANEDLEVLEITKIINLYLEDIVFLFRSARGYVMDTNYKLSTFESMLKQVTFKVTIDYLCERIERELLNNTPEHNIILKNIIVNKMQDIENLYLTNKSGSWVHGTFMSTYQIIKAERIDLKESYLENINFNKRLFLHIALPLQEDRTYIPYGTLETFYTSILNLFNKGKDKINNLLSPIQQSIQDTQVPDKNKSILKLSYKWENNPEKELPALYNKMKGRFIDKNNTLEQFTAIFTGKPIESITPLNWIETKNLLAYFIDIAVEKNKLPNTDIWATAKFCFKNGNNLAKNKQTYLNNKNAKPKNHTLIDTLYR